MEWNPSAPTCRQIGNAWVNLEPAPGEIGRSYFEPQNKKLYVKLANGVNPNSKTVEALRYPHLLTIFEGGTNVEIRNITFEKNADLWDGSDFVALDGSRRGSAPVNVLGYNISIDNCAFRYGSQSGATFACVQSDIRNCIFELNGSGGFFGQCNYYNPAVGANHPPVQNVIVENCIVRNNDNREFAAGWHGGNKLVGVRGWTIKGNIFYRNNVAALWFDYCYGQHIVENNVMIASGPIGVETCGRSRAGNTWRSIFPPGPNGEVTFEYVYEGEDPYGYLIRNNLLLWGGSYSFDGKQTSSGSIEDHLSEGVEIRNNTVITDEGVPIRMLKDAAASDWRGPIESRVASTNTHITGNISLVRNVALLPPYGTPILPESPDNVFQHDFSTWPHDYVIGHAPNRPLTPGSLEANTFDGNFLATSLVGSGFSGASRWNRGRYSWARSESPQTDPMTGTEVPPIGFIKYTHQYEWLGWRLFNNYDTHTSLVRIGTNWSYISVAQRLGVVGDPIGVRGWDNNEYGIGASLAFEANGAEGDPQFENLDRWDVRLKPGSPAAGKGVNNLVLQDLSLDGDTLPDWWEIVTILRANNMNNPEWTNLRDIEDLLPNGDLDGDGVTNALEYTNKSDPLTVEVSPKLISYAPTASGGKLSIIDSKTLTVEGNISALVGGSGSAVIAPGVNGDVWLAHVSSGKLALRHFPSRQLYVSPWSIEAVYATNLVTTLVDETPVAYYFQKPLLPQPRHLILCAVRVGSGQNGIAVLDINGGSVSATNFVNISDSNSLAGDPVWGLAQINVQSLYNFRAGVEVWLQHGSGLASGFPLYSLLTQSSAQPVRNVNYLSPGFGADNFGNGRQLIALDRDHLVTVDGNPQTGHVTVWRPGTPNTGHAGLVAYSDMLFQPGVGDYNPGISGITKCSDGRLIAIRSADTDHVIEISPWTKTGQVRPLINASAPVLQMLGGMIEVDGSVNYFDLDNDEMLDSWEESVITNLLNDPALTSEYPTVTSIESFLPSSDLDLDGVSNLDEYGNGTNPLAEPDDGLADVHERAIVRAGLAQSILDVGPDTDEDGDLTVNSLEVARGSSPVVGYLSFCSLYNGKLRMFNFHSFLLLGWPPIVTEVPAQLPGASAAPTEMCSDLRGGVFGWSAVGVTGKIVHYAADGGVSEVADVFANSFVVKCMKVIGTHLFLTGKYSSSTFNELVIYPILNGEVQASARIMRSLRKNLAGDVGNSTDIASGVITGIALTEIDDVKEVWFQHTTMASSFLLNGLLTPANPLFFGRHRVIGSAEGGFGSARELHAVSKTQLAAMTYVNSSTPTRLVLWQPSSTATATTTENLNSNVGAAASLFQFTGLAFVKDTFVSTAPGSKKKLVFTVDSDSGVLTGFTTCWEDFHSGRNIVPVSEWFRR